MNDIGMVLWFDADESFDSRWFKPCLAGMERNPQIDFLIVTNDSSKFGDCACRNIWVMQYNRSELLDQINSYFKFAIPYGISSKNFGRQFVCGLRTFAPLLFPKLLAAYKYYGWLDHEVILDAGVDTAALELLKPDKFNLGVSDLGYFQIIRNDTRFLKYLENVRFALLNWIETRGNVRGFDHHYYDDWWKDGLLGFVTVKKIYMKKHRLQSVNIFKSDSLLSVGNNNCNRPIATFSITYRGGTFDVSTIECDDKEYIAELIVKPNVWCLDRYYKGIKSLPDTFTETFIKHTETT